MSLLGSIFRSASNVITNAQNQARFDVQEFDPGSFRGNDVTARDGCLTLYSTDNKKGYVAILKNLNMSTFAFCIFRMNLEKPALEHFSKFGSTLGPIWETTARVYTKVKLQEICDAVRANPEWACVHVASHFGLTETLFHRNIRSNLDVRVVDDGQPPLLIACAAGQSDFIVKLLEAGADTHVTDNDGNNVFHCLANIDNPKAIQLFLSEDCSGVNSLNHQEETPLHIAAKLGNAHSLELLLRIGAEPDIVGKNGLPIHTAIKYAKIECIVNLCRIYPQMMNAKNPNTGETPIHMTSDVDVMQKLVELGCNPNAPDEYGETVLHMMARQANKTGVLALLLTGIINLDVIDNGGQTPLHHAAALGALEIVKILVIFGVSVNMIDSMGHTARHVAALSHMDNSAFIISILHRVGGYRCASSCRNCTDMCSNGGSNNGVIQKNPAYNVRQEAYDMLLSLSAGMAMLAANRGLATGAYSDEVDSGRGGHQSQRKSDTVLCLDGGGIRGLVLIQLLRAIEKTADKSIIELFDWIVGTSTGGILALALTHGYTIEKCQAMYFKLKNKVFCGKRPYDSEPLETLLKEYFGEDKKMDAISHPKVICTGVLADRFPAALHLFRNYAMPDQSIIHKDSAGNTLKLPPVPSEQLVWKAARASGAAPTYFRPIGRFLDGGLISNNPTMDAITEIHNYYKIQKEQGLGTRKIGVLISLGTGRVPVTFTPSVDVYRPENILDATRIFAGVKGLGALLVDQATAADGAPVKRAEAWCQMAGITYIRLSPPLAEDTQLDEKKDDILINMMIECQAYINESWSCFEEIAKLLKNC